MALNVQFQKLHNVLTQEDIIVPRIVNQQTLEFNDLCEYLADGSTVTAADVSAVMKQIEMRLPLILALNSKVVCSPEGLTFRPKVSGSITQSQLKAKLEAKIAADPTLDIDVNRALALSDLTISDLTASIAIELPKKWDERFQSKAQFKRISKAAAEESGGDENENQNENSGTGGSNENENQNSGGTNPEPGTVNPEPGNGGSGNDGGDGTDES
jgi:hypothetical protein